MIKKAVILAAGRGTRLLSLTYDLPKPMIPLLGKPVMEYIVEHLAHQGVREIMVNTSHLAHRIEQYFGDGRRFGVHIGYSFEGHLEDYQLLPEPVGSAGALRKINDLGGFIDTTTAVLCGDAVVDVDLQAAAARHRAQGALATVITKEVALQDVGNHGVVVSRADGRVVSFQEKPAPQQALSRQGLPFFSQCLAFEWLDIGRVADCWQMVQRLMQGGVAGIGLPGREVRPGVHVGLNTAVAWGDARRRAASSRVAA